MMNKEEILKNLFQLPKDDILDILEIINGYKENEITKDDMLASALNYETTNIKAYLKLKNILHISSSIFKKIIEELQGSDSNE